jgi:hypothetical protein
LNWRKGLFRLWILASSTWIVIFGILNLKPAIGHLIQSVEAERELQIISEPNDPGPDSTLREEVEHLSRLMKYNETVKIAAL